MGAPLKQLRVAVATLAWLAASVRGQAQQHGATPRGEAQGEARLRNLCVEDLSFILARVLGEPRTSPLSHEAEQEVLRKAIKYADPADKAPVRRMKQITGKQRRPGQAEGWSMEVADPSPPTHVKTLTGKEEVWVMGSGRDYLVFKSEDDLLRGGRYERRSFDLRYPDGTPLRGPYHTGGLPWDNDVIQLDNGRTVLTNGAMTPPKYWKYDVDPKKVLKQAEADFKTGKIDAKRIEHIRKWAREVDPNRKTSNVGVYNWTRSGHAWNRVFEMPDKKVRVPVYDGTGNYKVYNSIEDFTEKRGGKLVKSADFEWTHQGHEAWVMAKTDLFGNVPVVKGPDDSRWLQQETLYVLPDGRARMAIDGSPTHYKEWKNLDDYKARAKHKLVKPRSEAWKDTAEEVEVETHFHNYGRRVFQENKRLWRDDNGKVWMVYDRVTEEKRLPDGKVLPWTTEVVARQLDVDDTMKTVGDEVVLVKTTYPDTDGKHVPYPLTLRGKDGDAGTLVEGGNPFSVEIEGKKRWCLSVGANDFVTKRYPTAIACRPIGASGPIGGDYEILTDMSDKGPDVKNLAKKLGEDYHISWGPSRSFFFQDSRGDWWAMVHGIDERTVPEGFPTNDWPETAERFNSYHRNLFVVPVKMQEEGGRLVPQFEPGSLADLEKAGIDVDKLAQQPAVTRQPARKNRLGVVPK
jgi:hypothetical protein